jgi:hypothetical protein
MKNNTGAAIARQSQLKLITEWSKDCGVCLTLKDLIAITNVMVDYVENGYSKDLGTRLEAVDNYINQLKDGK